MCLGNCGSLKKRVRLCAYVGGAITIPILITIQEVLRNPDDFNLKGYEGGGLEPWLISTLKNVKGDAPKYPPG